MELRSEMQFTANKRLSLEEATLFRRMKNLTKERDELILEERELEMALKQRKECGKNIKAKVKSILHHPSAKNMSTEMPFATLEQRKRNVSANLAILGRQLVTLDQQILAQRDESLSEPQDKEFETESDSGDESICQIVVELIH